MSNVRLAYGGYRYSMKATASVVTTGWVPGQLAAADTSNEGYVGLVAATGTRPIGFIMDDDNELSSPPSGARVTLVAGQGLLYINHAEEVAAGSSTRAYATDVESATLGARVGWNSSGKITCLGTGSEFIGTLLQKPTSANNYEVGILFRL